jgi:3-hydroxyisobutyrate dehydrogenase-like beta-hydroxyacid dehydrogenase
MQVGFIGFGEVASTFSIGLIKNGATVCTCLDGRSVSTVENARRSGVKIYNTYKELAETSDILISSVVPSMAFEVSQTVSSHSKGIYVDMNNVSPDTVGKTLDTIENGKTVDAAIIGSVANKGLNVKIIASGPFADEFSELNNYGMNITVVGPKNGDASAIKLLRSAYTKGVSALLLETIYHGYKLGIDKEVLKYISLTEGEDFLKSANSRMVSSGFHAKRRSEEMEEVVYMLSKYQDPVMAKATSEFFKYLSENLKKSVSRSENYTDVYKLLYKCK